MSFIKKIKQEFSKKVIYLDKIFKIPKPKKIEPTTLDLSEIRERIKSNLEKDEVLCDQCNGQKNFGFCSKCFGVGKLTWIENILGKEENSYLHGITGVTGTSGVSGVTGISGISIGSILMNLEIKKITNTTNGEK